MPETPTRMRPIHGGHHMASHSEELHVLRIMTGRDAGERLSAMLDEIETSGTFWIDEEADRACAEWFCASPSEAAQQLELIRPLIESAGVAWEKEIISLPPADWAEAWKRFFHLQRVSDRLVIRPSWEPYDPHPGECVITLDPGMSFGTGRHATTRACLTFIDRLAAAGVRGSMIDAGCGSGILAIAAARLGFEPVTAFDNDPGAVAIARENARRNDVADAIAFVVADTATFAAGAPAAVVAANILAPTLAASAPQLARMACRDHGGILILSGILTEQFDDVSRAFAAAGFTPRETLVAEGWTSGRFERK